MKVSLRRSFFFAFEDMASGKTGGAITSDQGDRFDR